MTRLQILFAFLTTLLAGTPVLAVYSPELGRFRTRDPAGFVDGSHLMGYARSSPARSADPYGLWKLEFDDSVSPEDRERIQDAVDKACAKVRDANDAIDGASPCAQKYLDEKFGEEWNRTRKKLAAAQRECDSKETTINIRVDSDPDDDSFAWYQWKRRKPRNSPSDPDYPHEHFITFNNNPGNTWRDTPSMPPSRLLLHELFHVIERMTGDKDRDNTGLLDDPTRLERLDNGVERSRIGVELRQAEMCCEKEE